MQNSSNKSFAADKVQVGANSVSYILNIMFNIIQLYCGEKTIFPRISIIILIRKKKLKNRLKL